MPRTLRLLPRPAGLFVRAMRRHAALHADGLPRAHAWPWLLLVLISVCLCADMSGRSAVVSLDNDEVGCRIDPQQGTLTALVDKHSGRNLLAAIPGLPLYQITLQGNPTPLTARTAIVTAVTSQQTANGQTVVITFHHGGRQSIDVGCRFSLAAHAPEIQCRLQLRSPFLFTPAAIEFPVCALPLADATDEDDHLLLPQMDGVVLDNPARNMREQAHLYCEYPGSASVQLLARYHATGGCYLAAYDADGVRKQLGFAREEHTLSARVITTPALTPVTQYAVPYAIALGVFQGDWQAPATIYRQWAERQSWCHTPLSQRTDLPAWLLRAPLFYTIAMRGFPLPAGVPFAEWLPAHITELGRTFHTPVQAIVMGWEQHGYWITPASFPPYGGETAFRQLTDRLHANGHRAMLFLSGVKWTLWKTFGTDTKRPPYDVRDDFLRAHTGMAMRTPAQQLLTVGRPTDDMGQYVWLCPAVAETQALMVNAVRDCQHLGVTTVQLDQVVGGGVPVCSATGHGHPPGGGAWAAQAVAHLLTAMRMEGKHHDPDFALTIEEPGELTIPLLDAYHAREYIVNRWPREGVGMRGVPLFTFVYHAYALGYGGDSVDISAQDSRQSVLGLATNLVDGKIPAAAVWGRNLPPHAIHPDQAAMMQAALRLIQGPGRAYLLFGQRIAMPPLAVPAITVPCQNPATQVSRAIEAPSILHSGWALADGRIGVVLANITDAAITTNLTLPSPSHAAAPAYLLQRVGADGQPPTVLASVAALPSTISVTVPANSALLLEALPRHHAIANTATVQRSLP